MEHTAGQPDGRSEIRSLALAVALYVLVFSLKLAAALLTGVMALMAEALHTLSDIFVSGFLLVAALFSRRPADRVHMFGYGRAQNAAALVAATLFISFTSLRLYEEAVPRLFVAPEATYRDLPVALGVLLLSAALAGAPLLRLMRQRGSGAAARAQLLELVNDELAVRGVEGVHGLRAEVVGPDRVHAELHVEVAPSLTILEADRIGQAVLQRVERVAGCTACTVHLDPAPNTVLRPARRMKGDSDDTHHGPAPRGAQAAAAAY